MGADGVDCRYLTNFPSDICNQTGLSKTLITRRETIRLKHLQKTLFVYRLFGNKGLQERLYFMQFRDLFQYFEFLTNQLRGIYKFDRAFAFEDVDRIVKQDNCSFIDTLKMYKSAKSLNIK